MEYPLHHLLLLLEYLTNKNASFSFPFSVTKIVKKTLKTTGNKKKIIKLNSIESKISEELINNEISHEDFTTINSEERNYRELKESIRR